MIPFGSSQCFRPKQQSPDVTLPFCSKEIFLWSDPIFLLFSDKYFPYVILVETSKEIFLWSDPIFLWRAVQIHTLGCLMHRENNSLQFLTFFIPTFLKLPKHFLQEFFKKCLFIKLIFPKNAF